MREPERPAMSYSSGSKVDALLPRIDGFDDMQKMVYTGRLRMSRGLYAYVLDSRKNKKK
jgi:hypothetical protein